MPDENLVESELEKDIANFQEFARIAQRILSGATYKTSIPVIDILDLWIEVNSAISSIFAEGNHPLTENLNAEPSWDPDVLLPAGEVPFGIPELSFKHTRIWNVPASDEAADFFTHLSEIGVYLKRELKTKPKQISSLFKGIFDNLILGTGLDLTRWVNDSNSKILELQRDLALVNRIKRKLEGLKSAKARVDRFNAKHKKQLKSRKVPGKRTGRYTL